MESANAIINKVHRFKNVQYIHHAHAY